VRSGGESIGGGRGIRIKERFKGGTRVQRWAGRMLGLVGDDGLVIAHNRGEYLRAFKVLHRYTGSSLGVHGTGEAYQITIMVGALGQYKACTEIWISHYTTPALCSFDPSPPTPFMQEIVASILFTPIHLHHTPCRFRRSALLVPAIREIGSHRRCSSISHPRYPRPARLISGKRPY
jgi:hypothetical protein